MFIHSSLYVYQYQYNALNAVYILSNNIQRPIEICSIEKRNKAALDMINLYMNI